MGIYLAHSASVTTLVLDVLEMTLPYIMEVAVES